MSSRGCPSEDELVRMVEGALGNESQMAVESHLDSCEQCAAVIGGFGGLASSAVRPKVVGRYQLDRLIGGGGMGEVWAAWDPQLRRDIAVKLVKPERADDGRERERLKREARALARLTHPNVLAVYDVGETEDEVFIATELVVGDTLASRGGANADWRVLVKLYSQAARGLAAAHAADLVHRDIKPANLLIGTDGRVRVADFGLAVKTAAPSPLAATELAGRELYTMQITQTGYIAGTPAYMAPEQRLGEPPDSRADQYALCIALVESVAGRRPPLDIGREAMIEFVAERRPREPDLDRLCGVVARGLSIDRDDRYPDMDALADGLDACVAPTAISTDNVKPVARSPRPRRGKLVALVGGAAIAGVVFVLLATTLWNRGDAAVASPSHIALDVAADAAVAPDAALEVTPVVTPPIDAVSVEPPKPGFAPNAGLRPKAMPTAPAPPPLAPIAVAPSSIPVDVQSQIDLGLAAARRALIKRDGMTCLAAVNALPTAVPPMTAFNIELHRGQCEMLRGDCERGIKRFNAAADGMGTNADGESMAIALCPITGPFDVRLKRLVLQAHTAGSLALCRTYVKPAKALGAEATAASHKSQIGGVLRQLARCIGNGGDCAEATALWKAGRDLDQSPLDWDIEKCTAPAAPAPAASPNPAITAQAFIELLSRVQQGITRRDSRVCRELLATPTNDVPQGMQANYDLIAGFCKMMLGDCKAGSDLLAKVYPGNASLVASNADIYCPITGTLDQRLARMKMQLSSFADKRLSGARIEWCSYMIGPAKIAAREAQSADQRFRAGNVLQHIAWCISAAGRCGEANDLWSLSVATDSNATPLPNLSPKCP